MRTFENLIKDLGEEKGTRIVFNIDKIKKVLENPLLLKSFNLQVLTYLCSNFPINEEIYPLEQIARDFKMEIETVKEEIANLKDYGFLE